MSYLTSRVTMRGRVNFVTGCLLLLLNLLLHCIHYAAWTKTFPFESKKTFAPNSQWHFPRFRILGLKNYRTQGSNSITGPLKKGQVLVSPHFEHNFLFIDCRSAESVIMASHQIPACSFPWGGAQCVPRYRPQNLFHFRLELANGSRHHLVNGTGILWYKSDVQNEGGNFIQEQCKKQLENSNTYQTLKRTQTEIASQHIIQIEKSEHYTVLYIVQC